MVVAFGHFFVDVLLSRLMQYVKFALLKIMAAGLVFSLGRRGRPTLKAKRLQTEVIAWGKKQNRPAKTGLSVLIVLRRSVALGLALQQAENVLLRRIGLS
jgi:hypothetical protein